MLLLTPGPVTTHSSVRAAVAQDYAPRDLDFRKLVVAMRVLALARGRPGELTVLPLQGCGRFATKAAVRSFVAPGGITLVRLTGAYADRLVRLATEAVRRVMTLAVPAIARVDSVAIMAALTADPPRHLQGLVDQIKRRGMLISNDYNTMEPRFRIGCIGAITLDDMHAAKRAMDDAMTDFGLQRQRAA